MRSGNIGQGNDEARLEREVLALVLVEHPVRLTLVEVQKTLGRPPDVERALAALIGDGLLVLEGEEVAPTPAAVRFNELEPMEPPDQG
jgi:hypothetical protein